MANTPKPDKVLCDKCDQYDDHPKILVWGTYVKDSNTRTQTVVQDPNFHYDCLPTEYEEMIQVGDQHKRTRDTIAAARSGIHGKDLRDLHLSLDDDNQFGAKIGVEE